MNNHKLITESEDLKQREYRIKQQQQLRAMTKPTVPNKMLSADTMIEDLLSKKETFQKRKDSSVAKPPAAPPPWLTPDSGAVHPLYNNIWLAVRARGVGGQQLADTRALTALLMTSGLSTDTLGFIWSLANKTVPGGLTQPELYTVLALIALAQSGYIFNNLTVLTQVPQPPIPKLDFSVLPQLNPNFPTGQQVFPPSALASEPSGFQNSFNGPSAAASFPKEPAGCVPLDVNRLQSGSVMNVPNFNLGPTYQQNFGIGILHGNGLGLPVQNAPASGQTPGIPVLSGTGTVIPSISLGLSTPSTMTINQSSSVLNGVASVNSLPTMPDLNASRLSSQTTLPEEDDGFSDYTSFVSSNTFRIESPNTSLGQSHPNGTDLTSMLSELSMSKESKVAKPGAINATLFDIDRSTPGSEIVNSKADNFNIDESFDSLSSERAISSLSSAQNVSTSAMSDKPNKPPAPNYNLDLFELKNDVQPVFPDNGITSVIPDVEPPKDNDENVMFNPIFSEEDRQLRLSFNLQPELPRAEAGTAARDSFDDDFTDFQSADFVSVNGLSFSGASAATRAATATTNTTTTTSIATNTVSTTTQYELPVTNDDDGTVQVSFQKGIRNESNTVDDFSNFQEASANETTVSEDDLFPRTVTDVVLPSLRTEGNYAGWNLSSDVSSIDWSTGDCDVNKEAEGKLDDTSDENVEESLPNPPVETAVKMEAHANLQVEDKYSALRMLESSSDDFVSSDDFGDFLGAEPEQLRLAKLSSSSPAADASVQIRCLEACLEVLQTSYAIFSSASSPEVVAEVISDPRGTSHLTCLLEVFRVSERLTRHVENCDVVDEIQTVWKKILPYIDSCKQVRLEDTTGPVCGLCKCDYGPSPVKYGLGTFHAPCANLYLHYVNSTLPNTAAY